MNSLNATIRTVGDLKQYLDRYGLSPEKVAPKVSISNMTIRRLLRGKETAPIPIKYHAALDRLSPSAIESTAAEPATIPGLRNLEGILEEVERSGTSRANLPKIERELETKFQDPAIDRPVKTKIRTILALLKNPGALAGGKALALGALLYVLNPFDLVPDALPAIGYLDDFAVLSLVVDELLRRRAATEREAEPEAITPPPSP